MTQPLTPTQEDVTAARDFCDALGFPQWKKLLDGALCPDTLQDDGVLSALTVLARHAQAAREDALEQAEDAIRHCYDIGRIEAGLCGLLIGAIRSLDPLSIAEKGV